MQREEVIGWKLPYVQTGIEIPTGAFGVNGQLCSASSERYAR